MRVDLCGLAAGVAQELLDVSQVHPVLEEVGGEAVTQAVDGDVLGDPGLPLGALEHPSPLRNVSRSSDLPG